MCPPNKNKQLKAAITKFYVYWRLPDKRKVGKSLHVGCEETLDENALVSTTYIRPNERSIACSPMSSVKWFLGT